MLATYRGGTDMTTNIGQTIIDGDHIKTGTIAAQHVGANEIITEEANIGDAVITDAKIADLSAAKLKAGTALTSSLTVNGTALSTINSRAEDPATRINAKATQIDPGKITIWGGNLGQLADWRKGGDWTQIDGGAIAANTVSANQLTVGMRQIRLEGVSFEANEPGTDQVSWTAGKLLRTTNSGSVTSHSIAAGSAGYQSGRLLLFWSLSDSGVIQNTSDANAAYDTNSVVLAVYRGGTDLTVNVGQTIIDGDHIKTGTVESQHVDTNSFAASGLALFGGDLQSDDFSSGSQGWKIDKNGDAEFNDLVVREWVQQGAVSDGVNAQQIAAVNAPNGTVVLGPFNLGPTTLDQFWHFSITGEMRARGTTDNDPGTTEHGTELRLQRRTKTGGVWSVWNTMGNSGMKYGSTFSPAWSVTRHFQGVFQDVQIRAEINVSPSPEPDTTQTNVRNVGLVAQSIMR